MNLVDNKPRMSRAVSLVAISLLLAQSGLAETQLVASNPQQGAVIRRHDIMFSLRFNKRIENEQCSVWLQLPAGAQRTLSLQAQTASDQIEASGMNLGNGAYTLNWEIKTPREPVVMGTVSFSVR